MTDLRKLSRVEFLAGAGALLAGCSGGAGTLSSLNTVQSASSLPIAPSSAQVVTGQWTVKSSSDGATILSLLFRSGNQIDGSEFVVNGNVSGGGSSNGPVRITATTAAKNSTGPFHLPTINGPAGATTWHITRNAGEFNVFRFDGNSQSGDAVFIANHAFANQVTALQLGARDLLQLSLSGASVDDVQSIKSAFTDASAVTVCLVNLSTLSTADAVAYKTMLPSLTAEQLASFIGHGIKPSQVQDLQQAGLHDLSASDVVHLIHAHVDGTFVRSQIVNGAVPSVTTLLQMKSAAGKVLS